MEKQVKQFLSDAEKKEIGGRLLKAFQESSDITNKARMSEKLGYKGDKVIYKIIGGQQEMDFSTLENFSRATGYSIHWLLTGEGSKLVSETKLPKGESPIYFGEKETEIIRELAVENSFNFDEQVRELVIESLKARGLITDEVKGVTLSFFGQFVPKLKPMKLWGEIAAGMPIDVIEDFETVLVPEEFFVKGRENFALRVRGDSMEDDGIFEGDIIICYESLTANNGDTVVALVDGTQATVKRFYKERAQIRLQPKSARHKPIFLAADRVRIQGIVTGIFRRTV